MPKMLRNIWNRTITADAGFIINISGVDFSTRVGTSTATGNVVVRASTDNFVSSTFILNGETIDTNIVDISVASLNINSTVGGTITFRIYNFWTDLDDPIAGPLEQWSYRIIGNSNWGGLGISVPGIRLLGTVNALSSESDIANTAFVPNPITGPVSGPGVGYLNANASSGLTTSNAIKIGEFDIRDGGADLSDADNLNTILSELSFNVVNSLNLKTMAIFDGTTNVAETSPVDMMLRKVGFMLLKLLPETWR